MSAVLTGLVGRATGAEASGLRPRLPSLFEGGQRETGLDERQVERSAAPAVLPLRSERLGPEPPARRAATAETAPLRISPAPPIPTANPSPRPVPVALVPARPPHSAPKPILPVEPHRTGAPAQTIAPPPVISSPGESFRPAPEPLLPVQPAEHLQRTIAERLTGALSHPTRQAPPDPTTTATEPEITIQIGRLDIRADAPSPQPSPRRAPPAPSLPSLADYLRGGRR